MEKQFFNKKIITYNAYIWFKAEKYFDVVQKAKSNNTDVKIQVEGDMFMSSNVWGENQRCYTGICGFDALGCVKPLTGVNLDEDEWAMLTHNFNSVKDFFNGVMRHVSSFFSVYKMKCKLKSSFFDITCNLPSIWLKGWNINLLLLVNSQKMV